MKIKLFSRLAVIALAGLAFTTKAASPSFQQVTNVITNLTVLSASGRATNLTVVGLTANGLTNGASFDWWDSSTASAIAEYDAGSDVPLIFKKDIGFYGETPNRVLYLDNVGGIHSHPDITDTELGYLDGLTGSITNLFATLGGQTNRVSSADGNIEVTTNGTDYALALSDSLNLTDVTAGNFYGAHHGNGSGLTNLDGTKITGVLSNTAGLASNILAGITVNAANAAALTNHLRGMALVTDYGATGDGATDDTAAFQSAIASGRTVAVPAGTNVFIVGNMIVTNSLVGFGGVAKLQFKSGTTNYMIDCYTNAGVQLRNLWLEGGTNASTSRAGVSAIGTRHAINAFGYGDNARIENVWIRGFDGYGLLITGTGSPRNSNALAVVNVTAQNTHTGFDSKETYAEYINFVGIRAFGCRYGFRSQAGNQNITGAVLNDNYYGVDIYSGSNNGHGNFTGCLINHNTYPIQIVSCSTGETFTGCAMFGGIIYLSSAGNVVIEGCTLDVGEYRFESGYKNYIRNNTIGQGYANTVTHNYGSADETLFYGNYRRSGQAFGDAGWIVPDGNLILSSNGVVQTNATGSNYFAGPFRLAGALHGTNGVGTAGQVFTTDGTNVYWGAAGAGSQTPWTSAIDANWNNLNNAAYGTFVAMLWPNGNEAIYFGHNTNDGGVGHGYLGDESDMISLSWVDREMRDSGGNIVLSWTNGLWIAAATNGANFAGNVEVNGLLTVSTQSVTELDVGTLIITNLGSTINGAATNSITNLSSLSATGTVTAASFVGSGASITNLDGTKITGVLSNTVGLASNILAGATLNAANAGALTNYQDTNLVVNLKAAFSTNYTATLADSVLACTGTNQVITLPDGTNGVPTGRMFTVLCASTNGAGSVVITNANGAQQVLSTALSQTITNGQSLTVIWVPTVNAWR